MHQVLQPLLIGAPAAVIQALQALMAPSALPHAQQATQQAWMVLQMQHAMEPPEYGL